MIHITVEACNKDHWQLEIDVLKVGNQKLMNSMKAENNKIRLLKYYMVRFR